MLVTPDFTEVKDAVGPGTYKVRVVDATLGQWEKEGRVTPYINWRMETFGENEAKNNGRTIWHKTPVTGKGAFKLQDLYKAAMGSSLTGEFDTEQIQGKEMEVTVVENGQYTEIKTVRGIR